MPLLENGGVSPELAIVVRNLVVGNITTIDELVMATADHAYDCMESVDVLARNLETLLERVGCVCIRVSSSPPPFI